MVVRNWIISGSRLLEAGGGGATTLITHHQQVEAGRWLMPHLNYLHALLAPMHPTSETNGQNNR